MNRLGNPASALVSRDPIRAIEELWFQALAGGFHGPFCNCFGGAAVRLDAPTLEADILEYLLPRYAGESLNSLVEVLKQRRAQPVGRFIDWLRCAADAALDPALYSRLLDDTAGILASVTSASAGFACN